MADAWYADAPRGMWGVRVTGEQLVELDPDRRGLSLTPLADYTAPAVPGYAARGGRSIARQPPARRTAYLLTPAGRA
jgi:hypothetical protein